MTPGWYSSARNDALGVGPNQSAAVDRPIPSAGGATTWGAISSGLAIGGLAMSAIGAFYQGRAQRESLKSQALSLEFEQRMANVNARDAELDAAEIMRSAQMDTELLALQATQESAAERTSAAARGLSNVGSAAEVQASMELSRRIEARTINRGALRAAQQRKRDAVNYRNAGLMAGVSARNARGSARTLQPAVAAIGTAIQGGAGIASQYAYQERRR